MSIDVKDHRRYAEGKLAESIKAAAEKVAERELLDQKESVQACTGDEHLDKLIRVVQSSIGVVETHLSDVATQSVHLVQAEASLASKCEYFYTKGRLAAYKEIVALPAQILAEEKPTPLHLV